MRPCRVKFEAVFGHRAQAPDFWIVRGLRMATGLGARPDCRIADYSRTRGDLYQARVWSQRPA
eukprot:13210974-Alexandrium_andersonii.AAC.1